MISIGSDPDTGWFGWGGALVGAVVALATNPAVGNAMSSAGANVPVATVGDGGASVPNAVGVAASLPISRVANIIAIVGCIVGAGAIGATEPPLSLSPASPAAEAESVGGA